MALSPQPDPALKREQQLATRAQDLKSARKLKDLVLYELNAGMSVTWIAAKYRHLGATEQRITAFKDAVEAKRARTHVRS